MDRAPTSIEERNVWTAVVPPRWLFTEFVLLVSLCNATRFRDSQRVDLRREIVVMLRKSIIMAAVTILSRFGAYVQTNTIVLICLAALVAHLLTRPIAQPRVQMCEALALTVQCFTVCIGQYFFISLSEAAAVMLCGAIIIANCGVVMTVATMVFLHIRATKAAAQGHKAAATKSAGDQQAVSGELVKTQNHVTVCEKDQKHYLESPSVALFSQWISNPLQGGAAGPRR